MGRPFALLGFSVYGALVMAALGGPDVAGATLWVCAGLGLCFGVFGFAARKYGYTRRLSPPAGALAVRAPLFSAACILMAAVLSLFLSCYNADVLPVQQLAGRKSTIKALVLDYPQTQYHRYYYRLRVEQIDRTPVKPFTLRLSSASPLYCEPCDHVECTVGFYSFEQGGLYSQQNIQLAAGYQLGAYLAGGGAARIEEKGNSPGRAVAVFRRELARRFSRLLPQEDAALLQAMLLGKRDGLPEEAVADFRLVGCSHLLVVSGLHMGAVAWMVTALLRRLGLRRTTRSLLTGGALLVYLCVIGFPVSAVRAFVMCAIYLLGGCVGRRSDGRNSLGLALLLICLQDPFSGGDLSLALSVFATLGIIVLGPSVTELLLRPVENHPKAKRVFRPVAGTLGVTFSVMISTAPWQIFVFGGISLLSPLANLLLTAPCTLLLYCALFTLLFSLVPGLAPLARPFALCAGWLSRLVRGMVEILGGQPRAWVHLGEAELLALAGIISAVILLRLSGGHRRFRVAAGCMAVLVFAGYVWQIFSTRDTITLALAGEGEEACIALIRNGEAAVLYPGAREGDCVDMLRRNHVGKVSTLFLPVDGAKQRRSVRKICGAFPTVLLVLPDGTYVGRDLAPESTGAHTSFVASGESFSAFAGCPVTYDADNNCLYFRAYGVGFTVEFAGEGPRVHVDVASGFEEGSENSSFTVLPVDDIMDVEPDEELYKRLRAGRYLWLRSEDGLRLVVRPEGRLAVREGS